MLLFLFFLVFKWGFVMTNEIELRATRPGPKRILALDGGGVRGLITLGFLERIEEILAARSPNRAAFRLHDYFDLIGGTSTGAVIATLLTMGWRPAEIRALYETMLPKVFKKRRGYSVAAFLASWGFDTKFDGAAFSAAIHEAFHDIAEREQVHPELLTFEAQGLKTILAVVAKRIDTSSVWVQTNNPLRKYWTPNNKVFFPNGANFNPNRDYKLKTIVEASASAPYFVDPVDLEVDPQQPGLFIDGGVSPHNNPSKELFLMATLRHFNEDSGPVKPSPFGFGWPTGDKNILMISVGTGTCRNRISIEEYRKLPEVKQAIHSLRSVISDCEKDAVTWMQALSKPEAPAHINGKLDDMDGFRVTGEPLLSFQRYNATLEEPDLKSLMGADWCGQNLSPIKLKQLQEFDIASAINLRRLSEIGIRAAEEYVKEEHFPTDFAPDPVA